VLVFAPDNAAPEHPGVRVVRVPALPFPRYPGLRAGLPDPRIAAALLRFRPDVVHAVGPACLGIWGLLTARALGLPVVASYHTDLPRYLRGYGLHWGEPAIWPLIRRVHNGAHVNLCPSRFTRRELRAHGVREVGLWRGGVDTERFHPRHRSLAVRSALTDGRPDAPLVLYVGRLAPEKSVETLAWVLDANPGARLALVGDGPARPRLERVFRDQPVHFAGFLHGDALSAAFASADVFVMPSTTETLGFVVLEAMASGTPVVAADAGGIPDLVSHGENGWLYDPTRLDGAAEPVRRLLESRSMREHAARMGRKHAENCTWELETRRLVGSYEEAIARVEATLVGRVRRWFPV
jgi:glycosyltransferase involved in cell wall biosynthesis